MARRNLSRELSGLIKTFNKNPWSVVVLFAGLILALIAAAFSTPLLFIYSPKRQEKEKKEEQDAKPSETIELPLGHPPLPVDSSHEDHQNIPFATPIDD